MKECLSKTEVQVSIKTGYYNVFKRMNPSLPNVLSIGYRIGLQINDSFLKKKNQLKSPSIHGSQI